MANVTIVNRLPQKLTISLLDEQGVSQPVDLQPNATSSPVDESRLTPYTNGLASQGRVRINR